MRPEDLTPSEGLLAEGATGSFFETFVLIANPSEQPADVTLRFLRETGEPIVRTRTIPARGRLTINVELEDPELANGSVATEIPSTQPVVAERAQYWPFSPAQWYESHGSFPIVVERSMYASPNGQLWGLGTNATATPLPTPLP